MAGVTVMDDDNMAEDLMFVNTLNIQLQLICGSHQDTMLLTLRKYLDQIK